MNTSGEAADQVVRMSLEVGEAALKISGAGAKQLAVPLYAILKEQKKTRGRARLETLVRSGRPLTVFSVKESDLRKFVQEAKRYGILYCAVRNPRGSSDGMVDIMVKEEDAPRINRIVERFQFATVTEAAQIKTEIEKSREQKVKTVGKEATGMKKSGKSLDVPERTGREKSDTDQLMEELMGAPSKKEETQPRNPSLAKTEKSLLSEPISERHSRTAEGTSSLYMEIGAGGVTGVSGGKKLEETISASYSSCSAKGKKTARKSTGASAATEQESEKNKQREVKEMSTNFDSMLNVSAVPQDDRTAAFIAESKNNRNRCYELSEQITAAVATDSQMFQKYLDVQSRFDRYTASNSLLILAQRPEAQKLGDYSYWRSQGTFVKRQERDNPVLILEPGKEYEREDGSIGTYYNAKKLYEPSQTSLRNYTQDKPQVTEQQLIRALLSNPPVNIVPAEPDQMPEGKGALFAPDEKCIYVRKGMDAQSIFLSLSPELALAGFADGNKMYDRDAEAFHAYCASYMLCKKYGIDTQYFDFSHAPEFFENMESQEVRAELAKAQESFKHINARMEKSLQQERNQTERQQPHMGSHSQREEARLKEIGRNGKTNEMRTKNAHGR